MANRYSAAARKAANLTNKQLATEIASLGRLTKEELQGLLPKKRDKKAFLELMKIVESEKAQDEKLAYLADNLQSAGKVVFKVLGLFL